MYRLTTPEQKFKFVIDPTTFSKMVVTYQQNNTNIIQKELTQLSPSSETEGGVTYYVITFSLTQEETKKLTANEPCYVQVRVLTNEGKSWASNIFRVNVRDVLNNEVLQ